MNHFKTIPLIRSLFLLGNMLLFLSSTNAEAIAQTEYGSISGKFVLTGTVPKPVFVIKNGRLKSGQVVPYAAACGALNLKSDELLIDPQTKGIGHIFIYLVKAPKTIHPLLKAVPKKRLVYDQKNCRFIPHTLIVRAGQTVEVRTSDPVAHHCRVHTFKNLQFGNTISPRQQKRLIVLKETESLPSTVTCAMHSWMRGYWLVLNHPYASVTASEGKQIGSFKIDKLPVGTYHFQVWHEKVGWIAIDWKKGFTITVKAKKNVNKTFKLTGQLKCVNKLE